MRPDFGGVWQADLAKSVLRGALPRQLVSKIVHQEPRLDQEILVVQANGDEQRMVFRYQTTGEETTNLIGVGIARTCARWEGAELVIESWLEAGGRAFHFKDYWWLSADGATLTMAHRDDDLAGQTVVHARSFGA